MYRGAESIMEAASTMRRGSRALPESVAREAAELFGQRRIRACVGDTRDQDSTVHPRNAEQIIEQLRAFAHCVGKSSNPLIESPELRLSSTGRAYRQKDYLHNKRILLRRIIVEGMGTPGAAATSVIHSTMLQALMRVH